MADDEWEIRHDASSGVAYYYNKQSGQSMWDAPPGVEAVAVPAHAEWTQTWDENGHVYYVNAVTMETSWDPPAAYIPGTTRPTSRQSISSRPSSRPASRPNTAQQMERLNALLDGGDDDSNLNGSRPPSRGVSTENKMISIGDEGSTACDWMMFVNEVDNVPYYFNVNTEECVWEPPTSFIAYHALHSVDNSLEQEQNVEKNSDERSRTPIPVLSAPMTPDFEDKVRKAIEQVSKTPMGSSRLLLVHTPTFKRIEGTEVSEAGISRPSSRPTSQDQRKKREMQRQLVREESALLIQCLIRCFLARRRVQAKRLQRQSLIASREAERIKTQEKREEEERQRIVMEQKYQEEQVAVEEAKSKRERERAAQEAAEQVHEELRLKEQVERLAKEQRDKEAQAAMEAKAQEAAEQEQELRRVVKEQEERLARDQKAQDAIGAEVSAKLDHEIGLREAAERERTTQQEQEELLGNEKMEKEEKSAWEAASIRLIKEQAGRDEELTQRIAPEEAEGFIQKQWKQSEELKPVIAAENEDEDEKSHINHLKTSNNELQNKDEDQVKKQREVKGSEKAPVSMIPKQQLHQALNSTPASTAPISQPSKPLFNPHLKSMSLTKSRSQLPSILDITSYFPVRKRHQSPVKSTSHDTGICRKPISIPPPVVQSTSEQRLERQQARRLQQAIEKDKWKEDVAHYQQIFAQAAIADASERTQAIRTQQANTEKAMERLKAQRAQDRLRTQAKPLKTSSVSEWIDNCFEQPADVSMVTLKNVLESIANGQASKDITKQRIDKAIKRLQTRLEHVKRQLIEGEKYLLVDQVSRSQYVFQSQYRAKLCKMQREIETQLIYWQGKQSPESNNMMEACVVSNDYGDRLLHAAVWQGNFDAVSLILSTQPKEINQVDNTITQWTPLHEASRRGHVNIVELLLTYGALLDVQDLHGDTPLHVACRSGWTALVRVLLKAGETEPKRLLSHTKSWFECFNLVNSKHQRAIDVTRLPSLLEILTDYDEALNASSDHSHMIPTIERTKQRKKQHNKTQPTGSAQSNRSKRPTSGSTTTRSVVVESY